MRIESTSNYLGLFGYVSGAIIKNLGLEKTRIRNDEGICVGGICGYAEESEFDNCYYDGYAFGGTIVGGIAGLVTSNTKVSNCYNLGNIEASNVCAGGICGAATVSSEIVTSYNAGKVTTDESSMIQYGLVDPTTRDTGFAGGITGNVSQSTIENCYNIGTIENIRNESIGGISGAALSSKINYCYNAGIIISESACGICGPHCNSTDVSDCYYLKSIDIYTGVDYLHDYCMGCTFDELKSKETFKDFDFTDIWVMGTSINNPFPVFKSLLSNGVVERYEIPFEGGDGSEENPYLIKTKEQLNAIRSNFDAYYKLIADIEFLDSDFEEGGYFYNNGQKWMPLKSTITSFRTSLDGNGHVIKNLQINTDIENVGLFSEIEDAKILDLGIIDANIVSTAEYVGGFCGTSLFTKFANCYFSGTVKCYSNVGGIAGNSTGSEFSSCYQSGTVLGYGCVGGICGASSESSLFTNCYNLGNIGSSDTDNSGGICGLTNFKDTFSNCYNYGLVSAGNCAGGICGSADDTTITLCYNTSRIDGGSNVGGICGNANMDSITCCYNMGVVYGYSQTGGICGTINNETTLTNCYNARNITGTSDNACYFGGICGYVSNDSTVSNSYNIGCVIGYEFLGAICGNVSSNSTVSNCYYYLNSYGIGIGYYDEGTDTCIACTFDELKNQATFVDFDFDTVWEIDGTSKYTLPTLKGIKQTECVNHFWSGTVTEKATCTKDGIVTYSCEVCGDTMTEDIPKTGHKYGSWQKYSTTQHKRVCENDSSHVEYASHTWNSGKVTKKATCTATGVKTYTCTTCGTTKTETIAKTAHSYSSTTKKCSCGKVNPSYTGLIKNSNGSYTYYVKGVASTKTGLYKMPSGSIAQANKTIYLKSGKFQNSYTGLVKDGTKYKYVSKGILSTTTGLVKMPSGSPQAGKYVYLKSGVFQSSYTGLVKEGSKYKYVVKGIFTTKTGSVKMPSTSTYYKNKTVKLKSGIKV